MFRKFPGDFREMSGNFGAGFFAAVLSLPALLPASSASSLCSAANQICSGIFRKCFEHFQEIPGKFPDISRIIPGNVQEIYGNFSGHAAESSRKFPADISRTCPGNCPESSRSCSGHVRKLSGKMPVNFPHISGRVQGSVWEMFRTFSGIFRKHSWWKFPGNIRESSRKLPDISRYFPGKFTKSGKCPGHFRDVSRTYSESFREMPGKKPEMSGKCPGFVLRGLNPEWLTPEWVLVLVLVVLAVVLVVLAVELSCKPTTFRIFPNEAVRQLMNNLTVGGLSRALTRQL